MSRSQPLWRPFARSLVIKVLSEEHILTSLLAPSFQAADANPKDCRGKGGFISEDAENFSKMHGKGELRWLVGNYEAGDVVFHNPWMIHAATKNEDKLGRIRLASDLRFYEDGAAIDQRWMKLFKYGDGL